ncbi:hypothetical protein GCM10009850_087490 [Nonomuraea monospora]|uniref:Uncharacterized protein n=1 Tax=Nonomuraea monospora TaxID=568818 RepID=A0ABN3CV10_9ACTN
MDNVPAEVRRVADVLSGAVPSADELVVIGFVVAAAESWTEE